jgi:hypothetical protein
MSSEATDPTPGEGQDLFGLKPVATAAGDKPAAAGSAATARVIMPNRAQIELRPMDLESDKRLLCRFLFIGSQLRSTLPPHTRSPSCSCASLRSL